MSTNFQKPAPSGSQVITNEFFETRARVRPGPDLLDRANAGPGPGLSEGKPDLEVQGQVQKNWLRSGPDRPVDSLDSYERIFQIS
jgi:hypothetical protein